MLNYLYYNLVTVNRQPSTVNRQPSTLHFKFLKVILNRLVYYINTFFTACYIYFIKKSYLRSILSNKLYNNNKKRGKFMLSLKTFLATFLNDYKFPQQISL